MNLRKFQLSDDLFWGYQLTLDLDFFTNEQHLINIIKEDMIQFFKSKNLLQLVDKISQIELHIPPLSKIKQNINQQLVYVCSHRHNCNCCK